MKKKIFESIILFLSITMTFLTLQASFIKPLNA